MDSEQSLYDTCLHVDWDTRKPGVEPLKLLQESPDHGADGHHLASAGFHVDLLSVKRENRGTYESDVTAVWGFSMV